eukprot:m.263557 g.263557  ORF g.263557 m.263557 type:complete len:331 (-) comp50993_c0_seq1:48-1040(-)
MNAVTVRRVAFDIGSGGSKVQIADVVIHGDNVRVAKVLYANQIPCKFGVDLSLSASGQLSETIMEYGLTIMTTYMAEAKRLDATVFGGVATEVFRKATNGLDYIARINNMGANVRIVTQDLEAKLGYQTAVVVAADVEPGGLVVWDSGGASFQITAEVDGMLEKFMRPCGVAIVTKMCVEAVQCRDYQTNQTPNPVTLSDAQHLIELIQSDVMKQPTRPSFIHDNKTVVAIGGRNSIFRLAEQVSGSDVFSPEMVKTAINKLINKTDGELQQAWCNWGDAALVDPPSYLVPKLCLLYAVMIELKISSVKFVTSDGSCSGVLVTNDLFDKV